MPTNTSQHILPTAANLLGFCLFVITSIHISNKAASTMIDEFVSVIALLLTFSCLFSFIAIRSTNNQQSKKLESIGEYFFFVSLFGNVLVILFFVFGIIK